MYLTMWNILSEKTDQRIEIVPSTTTRGWDLHNIIESITKPGM